MIMMQSEDQVGCLLQLLFKCTTVISKYELITEAKFLYISLSAAQIKLHGGFKQTKPIPK